MSASDSVITITKAHILRHAPTKSAAGWPAAVMDVGQDLLLRHLAECGVLDLVAFKGGTSIRKVYAGAGGRFSTDLDFSIANLNDNPATVLDMVTDSIKGTEIGPFRFDIERRRERPEIVYHYQGDTSGTGALRSKLDVGPPPWLAPELKRWVPAAIHRQYGGALPPLPVVDLAENVAEKIARLNRASFARDAFDLVWLSSTPGLPELDRTLVRRLVVLKCWVDLNGLTAPSGVTWSAPLPNARPFDPDRWIRKRGAKDFDDESIGLLTTPPPSLEELGAQLAERYRWLAVGLTDDELAVARCEEGDRRLVLGMLSQLPGRRVVDVW
jgi:predicted nucleotidyltransferase component of viral defense system